MAINKEKSIRLNDISLVCVLRRITRDIPCILAVGLIAALLTVSITQALYKPQYTANATVAINVKNSSYTSVYSNLSSTTEIAGTFTGLFGSEIFKELSAGRPGSDALAGKLSAYAIPQTNILQLTVTADDPISAFRTLRFWLDNYDTISDHVFQNVVLRELDAPTVPRSPSNPPELRSAAKRAFLFGAAGMLFALLCAAVLADTVQTSDAMRHNVDAKLFATIHHEEKNKTLRSRIKRAKKALLITSPTTGFYFTEEIEKLASRFDHSAQQRQSKVLLITSVTEGEGKSTVAANLAISLGRMGKRVLLIDADMHKSSQYKLFGRRGTCELSRMLAGSNAFQADHLEKEQIYAIFSFRARPNASELLATPKMHELLTAMRSKMDYIIIDTPPLAIFSDAEMLASEADLSLLVVKQDLVTAPCINDAIDALRKCSALFLGCIFNDVRHSPLPYAGHGYGYGYNYGYGYGRRYGYGYGAYGGYSNANKHKDNTGEDTHGRTQA